MNASCAKLQSDTRVPDLTDSVLSDGSSHSESSSNREDALEGEPNNKKRRKKNLSWGTVDIRFYAPQMTSADIRSYYLRPPYVTSWITDGGAYVLSPNQQLLTQLLTEALSPSTRTVQRQSVTIEVMNGTSIPGYEELASTRLNYAGFETTIIPSDRQDYAYSVLIDKSAAQNRSAGDTILNVMGMTSGSLIPSPDVNSSSDYLLILGYDYQPCFRPEKMVE